MEGLYYNKEFNNSEILKYYLLPSAYQLNAANKFLEKKESYNYDDIFQVLNVAINQGPNVDSITTPLTSGKFFKHIKDIFKSYGFFDHSNKENMLKRKNINIETHKKILKLYNLEKSDSSASPSIKIITEMENKKTFYDFITIVKNFENFLSEESQNTGKFYFKIIEELTNILQKEHTFSEKKDDGFPDPDYFEKLITVTWRKESKKHLNTLQKHLIVCKEKNDWFSNTNIKKYLDTYNELSIDKKTNIRHKIIFESENKWVIEEKTQKFIDNIKKIEKKEQTSLCDTLKKTKKQALQSSLSFIPFVENKDDFGREKADKQSCEKDMLPKNKILKKKMINC